MSFIVEKKERKWIELNVKVGGGDGGGGDFIYLNFSSDDKLESLGQSNFFP